MTKLKTFKYLYVGEAKNVLQKITKKIIKKLAKRKNIV